jgi:predicted secreted acid phosphatase
MRCYLFDIDGTIADLTHRLHHIEKTPKDWDAFFDSCHKDAPIPHIVELAALISKHARVIFVSGRSDRCRSETMEWLCKHGLGQSVGLFMRKDGDHRPDNVVKLELLEQIKSRGYEPIMAFDDRNQVVEMWRANGVPCAQVAPGDF